MSQARGRFGCRWLGARGIVALAAGCALAAGAAPAAAQEAPPDLWLAETPAALGSRFGLGLDVLFDQVDDLEAVRIDTLLTVTDADGRSTTELLCRDPAEVNRRFDFDLEVRRFGAQVPIALPRLPLGRGAALYPSVVVEAATVEAKFDFEDAQIPRSFEGRGASYGGAIEAVAISGRGRWLLGAGYRYRSLLDVELERSRAIENAEVEAELGLDEHLATVRFGRLLAGGRVAPYLGARRRWSEVDLDDEVREEIFGGEVLQEERTAWRFEQESTFAVAGVDARLGSSLVGRAEVSWGDDSTSGLLKLVYLPGHRGGGYGGGRGWGGRGGGSTVASGGGGRGGGSVDSAEPQGGGSPASEDSRRPRRPRTGRGAPPWTPERPAAAIADRFRDLRDVLSRAARDLDSTPSADSELRRCRGRELVARVEAEGTATLERHGYSGLADWFRERADEARNELGPAGSGGSQALCSPADPGLGVALASLHGAVPAQSGDTAGDDWLARLTRAVSLVLVRAEQRCLDVELAFNLEGAERASMWVHLRGAPGAAGVQIRAGRGPQRLRIGSYSYEVTVRRQEEEPTAFRCTAEAGGPLRQCPLDLVSQPVRAVNCDFTAGFEECRYAEPHPHCTSPAG